MDSEGHAKHILASVRRMHAKSKGPSNPDDPASVKEHEKQLAELDGDVVIAKLSINDDNPSGKQD